VAGFPLLDQMPAKYKPLLLERMGYFMETKMFEPCGDLEEVTNKMKVFIAAQASMLVLKFPLEKCYPSLKSILVYPKAYLVERDDGGHDLRLGESWGAGSVVLAWQSVKQGAADDDDGRNVTFHEFAHQLDQSVYGADGVPKLRERDDFRKWSAAFAPAYEKFVDRVNRGRKTVIDPYGATNPAEFFAVLTETFFEKPHQLKDKYPEVYRQIARYYEMDPLSWGGMNS